MLEALVKKVKVSRAALRQEAQERVDLFLAIGEFIFEFSQLEFTIRPKSKRRSQTCSRDCLLAKIRRN
jgi:hypothetical protein